MIAFYIFSSNAIRNAEAGRFFFVLANFLSKPAENLMPSTGQQDKKRPQNLNLHLPKITKCCIRMRPLSKP